MTDIVFRLRMVDPNQVLLMEPPYDTRYLHAGLICHEAAAEIERLRAERQEDHGVIAVWRGRTQRAEAEIEQLRADAERYRWLRENALAMDTVADPDNFVQIFVGTDPASCFKARTLDAAIDAARAEERKP